MNPFETCLILDTETTTNKDTPERKREVIELAYKPFEGTEETVYRFKPAMPSTFGAMAVHHILPEELDGCPPSSMALEMAPAAWEYWVGHNIDFDWAVLGSPRGPKRICTLALSRELFPDLDSHSLSAVIYHLEGATPATRHMLRNAHSAAADIGFCELLLQHFIRVTKVDTPYELWQISEEARIPKKMGFGKFAGQPISAVDRGYANWYLKQTDTDPYILAAFRRAGLIR